MGSDQIQTAQLLALGHRLDCLEVSASGIGRRLGSTYSSHIEGVWGGVGMVVGWQWEEERRSDVVDSRSQKISLEIYAVIYRSVAQAKTDVVLSFCLKSRGPMVARALTYIRFGLALLVSPAQC
jgi:hypothetical protein